MNDEAIIKECELQFQAGGPKVYVVDRSRWSVRATTLTAKRAVEWNKGANVEVWARRKQRGVRQYEWKKVSA